MDMAINSKWFTDKLVERQLSQRGLAKLMGLDASAVSLMMRGKRRISIKEADNTPSDGPQIPCISPA